MRFLVRPAQTIRAVFAAETAPALPAPSPFNDLLGKFGTLVPDDFLGAWVVEVKDEDVRGFTAAARIVERDARAEIKPAHRVYGLTPPAGAPAPAVQGPAIPTRFSLLGIDKIWSHNIRGAGVKVGVIDTGFWKHDCFKKSVASHDAYDPKTGKFAKVGSSGGQYNDHGTFAAALIASAAINGKDLSVAPDAQLHLLEMPGEQFENDLSRAIQFLITTYGCQVLSLSLGTWDPTPFLDAPLKKARNMGALPVVAIGNDGKGVVTWPGACGFALSVGYCDDNGDLTTASGSTHFARGRNPIVPLVVAPGILIESAAVGGGTRTDHGSSFAAPIVAGLCALLLSACKSATVDQVEKAILDKCQWKAQYNERCAHGLPDGYQALDLLNCVTLC